MNKSEKSFLSLSLSPSMIFFFLRTRNDYHRSEVRINATDKTDPSRGIRHLTSK